MRGRVAVDRLEVDRLEEHAPLTGEQYNEGYVQALREVIAHLRQGDFLPGGQVYDEMVAD